MVSASIFLRMGVIASGFLSIASLNIAESGEPPERIFNTLTPYTRNSDARFMEKLSTALQGGAKPPVHKSPHFYLEGSYYEFIVE
ncbi:MAG: hypothetical protein ABIQ31_03540 [Ferruginibacter sp.]